MAAASSDNNSNVTLSLDAYYYPVGRQVFFRATGVSDKAEDFCRLLDDTDEFGASTSKGRAEKFRGFGTLVENDAGAEFGVVDVELVSGGRKSIKIAKSELRL